MNRNIEQLIAKPDWQQWLLHHLDTPITLTEVDVTRLPGQGNQAEVYRYQSEANDLALKCAFKRGIRGMLQRFFLRREWSAYQRLEGLRGIPRCYGLFADRVLVLDFINGQPYREADLLDRERWFEQFDELVQVMHQRGVSHGDMKRKANLIAGTDEHPWLLDFGVSVVLHSGWRPFNHWLFNYQCKTDINALLKHKYHGDYEKIDANDRKRLHYTWPEKAWRKLRPFLGIK